MNGELKKQKLLLKNLILFQTFLIFLIEFYIYSVIVVVLFDFCIPKTFTSHN
jgi:hypothetical protein